MPWCRRSLRRLGCNAELIVDEFGEKLLEELDYVQVGCCTSWVQGHDALAKRGLVVDEFGDSC